MLSIPIVQDERSIVQSRCVGDEPEQTRSVQHTLKQTVPFPGGCHQCPHSRLQKKVFTQLHAESHRQLIS